MSAFINICSVVLRGAVGKYGYGPTRGRQVRLMVWSLQLYLRATLTISHPASSIQYRNRLVVSAQTKEKQGRPATSDRCDLPNSGRPRRKIEVKWNKKGKEERQKRRGRDGWLLMECSKTGIEVQQCESWTTNRP